MICKRFTIYNWEPPELLSSHTKTTWELVGQLGAGVFIVSLTSAVSSLGKEVRCVLLSVDCQSWLGKVIHKHLHNGS